MKEKMLSCENMRMWEEKDRQKQKRENRKAARSIEQKRKYSEKNSKGKERKKYTEREQDREERKEHETK